MFDLEQLIKMQDPNFRGTIEEKAHDNINDLIDDFEHKDLLMGLVMGMGGGGANVGKTVKNILTKIKARNARGLRNLREGQGTGAQSMSSSDRTFLNKEHGEFRKLKELVKESDAVGLANPERADDIYSIFQKRFGNKNASKVMDIIYKKIFGE